MDQQTLRTAYLIAEKRVRRFRRLAVRRFCRATAAELALWGLIAFELLVFVAGVATPPLGRLVPVGKGVSEALQMLSDTPSGRRLIRDVRRRAGGDYIYLTLGETEKDRLFDCYGREVRGVTRAVSLQSGRRFRVRHVTVITNRDVTGGHPTEILKSLAFELENVLQVYRHPWTASGRDSPMAAATQERVLQELRYR
jgi:hypothetical protein